MMTLVLYLGIFAFGLFCIINPKYILTRAGQKKKKEYEKRDEKVIRIFGIALVIAFIVGMLSMIGGYYHSA